MTDDAEPQLDLFQVPGEAALIEPAAIHAEHAALAAELPPQLRLGTMSWSYPGWRGIVFGNNAPERLLARHGLAAYAQHPLLRAVELDRTYYDPLPALALRAYRDQVGPDFSFLLKAHDELILERFPAHPRYGARAGQSSPRFLDAAYATEAVIGPSMEGLGPTLGVLLFQFPPAEISAAPTFPERLHRFLSDLPRGPTYAVELRNRSLLTREYGEAIASAGAVHCHNAWGQMPSVISQAKALPKSTRRPLVIRWLMRPGDEYQAAKERFEPFNQIVEEDAVTRSEIADLGVRALAQEVPTFIVVDNKAEGCAPETIVHLAAEIVSRRRIRSEAPTGDAD